MSNKLTRKNILIICLILLIAALCFIIFRLMKGLNNNVGEVSGFQYESNATIGVLPGVDRVALLTQMQEYTDRSAIAYVVNVRPVLSDKGTIDILFENPMGNLKDLILELVDDGSEETLYKSGALAEGSYISTIELKKDYDSGTYPLTAFITGYELETHDVIGQTAAEIILNVK